MKYIGGIITAYIVLLVLDIMQRRNHTRTQSLKKFTVRTITDVSFICAIGALFVLVAFIWCLWSDRRWNLLRFVVDGLDPEWMKHPVLDLLNSA